MGRSKNSVGFFSAVVCGRGDDGGGGGDGKRKEKRRAVAMGFAGFRLMAFVSAVIRRAFEIAMNKDVTTGGGLSL